MTGKKILINACMVTPQPSGVGVYSIELLKELVIRLTNEKMAYVVYSYDTTSLQNLGITNLRPISLGATMDRLLKNNQTMHRHIWNIIYLNWIAKGYDILYSFSTHGTLLHKNQIITIHDLICLSFPESHRSQYHYFKRFIPLLLKRCKKIIAISGFTKNELLKHYSIESSKIDVVYNGVNHMERVSVTTLDESWLKQVVGAAPYCIIVGASYVHKNIETVLSACESLRDVNARFVFVNKPNPYYLALQKKASDLNLKNVVFLDYVSDEQLATLYKNARLNIYLSLYEGFGFPPAEAAFYGTQSLLSDRTALKEVYNSGFELTDPFNMEQITLTIRKYVQSEGKVQNNTYPALSKKYSWSVAADSMMDVFRKTFK